MHVLGEQGVLLESDFRTTVPTFGVNGYATAFIDQGELNGMAIDSNNRIVLAGRANGKIALARLTANGTLDNSFGQAGTVQETFGAPGASAFAVEIVAGDKIMVVVNAQDPASHMGVMRFTNVGGIDGTFGSGGRRLIDFPGTVNEQGFAIDCTATFGCVIAGGTNDFPGGGRFHARVAGDPSARAIPIARSKGCTIARAKRQRTRARARMAIAQNRAHPWVRPPVTNDR